MALPGQLNWNMPTGGWIAPPEVHGGSARAGFMQHPFVTAGQFEANATSRLAQDLARSEESRKQQAFGALMPLLRGGRGATRDPAIDRGPIWSPQDVQQNINMARAYNDQRMGSDIAGMEARTSAQGFGGMSPLIHALRQNYQGQNLAANTGAATDIRLRTTGENAKHRLEAESAYEDAVTKRQATEASKYNALLQALMGFAA